jgi:hypothetical protein
VRLSDRSLTLTSKDRTVRSTATRRSKTFRDMSLPKVGVARLEKRLVSKLMSAIGKKSRGRRSVAVSAELDCFQGVADVVAGTLNGYRLFPRDAMSKLDLVSFSTAKILSALSGRKSATVHQVVKNTGLSASTVRKETVVLRKLGILNFGAGEQINVLRKIRPPFKEIEAFEVKVKDWKSGIYQARNYKSFAHKVSVVLPLNRASRLRNRFGEFRRMRVGLLGIDTAGKLKWFLKPRRQRPISGPRNFLATVKLLRNSRPI